MRQPKPTFAHEVDSRHVLPFRVPADHSDRIRVPGHARLRTGVRRATCDGGTFLCDRRRNAPGTDVWSRIDALGRGGGLRRHRPSCLHAVLTELPAFQRFLCGAYDIARRSLSNSYTPISKLTAPNESIDKRDFDDRYTPPRRVTCRADDAGGSDAQGDSGMATAQGPARARPVPPADAREPRGSAPERARSHIDDAATRGGGTARGAPQTGHLSTERRRAPRIPGALR